MVYCPTLCHFSRKKEPQKTRQNVKRLSVSMLSSLQRSYAGPSLTVSMAWDPECLIFFGGKLKKVTEQVLKEQAESHFISSLLRKSCQSPLKVWISTPFCELINILQGDACVVLVRYWNHSWTCNSKSAPITKHSRRARFFLSHLCQTTKSTHNII